MKALITADWHISENPRDAYRWDFVEELLPNLIEEERVSLLLFLGDLTEAKSGFSAELTNRLVAAFQRLAALCPVVGLTGNHDGLSPDNPFWAFLGELENVSWVVGAPTPLHRVKHVPSGFPAAKRTILLPNTRNHERDWDPIDFREYDWALAHQCFTGAKSESGFELSGVPLSYFPKNLTIISGDIHKPQEVGNLIYVGAPYTIDFGDDFKPCVLLWDGKTLGPIFLEGAQKRLVEASSLKALRKRKVAEGDIVKVKLEIDSYDEWPEAKKEIERWAKEQGVALQLAQPVIASVGSTKVKTAKFETMSDEEILKAYARKRDVNEAFVNAGLKLL